MAFNIPAPMMMGQMMQQRPYQAVANTAPPPTAINPMAGSQQQGGNNPMAMAGDVAKLASLFGGVPPANPMGQPIDNSMDIAPRFLGGAGGVPPAGQPVGNPMNINGGNPFAPVQPQSQIPKFAIPQMPQNNAQTPWRDIFPDWMSNKFR